MKGHAAPGRAAVALNQRHGLSITNHVLVRNNQREKKEQRLTREAWAEPERAAEGKSMKTLFTSIFFLHLAHLSKLARHVAQQLGAERTLKVVVLNIGTQTRLVHRMPAQREHDGL